ncbi:hypothetical protein VSX61_19560 [Brenneria populi subsp. brevivirga]|uniref:hypothetical protein n=1 Tax=Brenneria populi TaxID=1505588 RepID=UPI002E18CB43|nr:hypothetical protein [Brenneria populi subsp. brevivirga]
MNQQPGNIVTQFFAWLAAIASAAGITTQDLIYIAFGAIGVIISITSFVLGRIDARNKRMQEERRTAAYERYIEVRSKRPLSPSEEDDAVQYKSLPSEESEA